MVLVMRVAEETGKFSWEVMEQPVDELALWAAWIELKNKEQEKAIRRAQTKARVVRPRGR